jgi:RimJ/RimL family protein N-acetyltransferase
VPSLENLGLDDLGWPVHTERLTLRRPRQGDAAATFAYRRDPAVAEWLTILPTDVASFTARFEGPEVHGTMVVLEDTDDPGVVIGELSIRLGDAWAQHEVGTRAIGVEAEIGWVLAPAHQGRGLATEAARAALDICFTRLGLRRVTAGCFVENEASWRIMEKLGMRREQHSRRDALHRTRGWLDGYQYALLADEYRAQPR